MKAPGKPILRRISIALASEASKLGRLLKPQPQGLGQDISTILQQI